LKLRRPAHATQLTLACPEDADNNLRRAVLARDAISALNHTRPYSAVILSKTVRQVQLGKLSNGQHTVRFEEVAIGFRYFRRGAS